MSVDLQQGRKFKKHPHIIVLFPYIRSSSILGIEQPARYQISGAGHITPAQL